MRKKRYISKLKKVRGKTKKNNTDVVVLKQFLLSSMMKLEEIDGIMKMIAITKDKQKVKQIVKDFLQSTDELLKEYKLCDYRFNSTNPSH